MFLSVGEHFGDSKDTKRYLHEDEYVFFFYLNVIDVFLRDIRTHAHRQSPSNKMMMHRRSQPHATSSVRHDKFCIHSNFL
jgi:hypothetical protein